MPKNQTRDFDAERDAEAWAYNINANINRLTLGIEEKAFDPDWFLLWQELRRKSIEAHALLTACRSAEAALSSLIGAAAYQGRGDKVYAVVEQLRAALALAQPAE